MRDTRQVGGNNNDRTSPRIVLYSHDTLGFGHLRRNLLIASALIQCDPKPEVLLIAGMREAGAFEFPPGVDCVSLPAYAKGSDGKYRPRDLGAGLAALTQMRANIIRAAVLAFAPDLMIVDNVPRGALYELDPTLRAVQRQGSTRLVLGLRDVIDRITVVRQQWLRQRNFETIRRFYNSVWIYGDSAVYDLATDCDLTTAMGRKSQHVGYLNPLLRCRSPIADTEAAAVLGDDPSPYVLCVVGGGRDGAAVCEAFVRTTLPEGFRGVIVTGSQMPETTRREVQRLAATRRDMQFVSFVREPIALMAGAARIVAMGGYNTTTEILALNRPALIVPRARPREEQVIRARRLAEIGAAAMLHPDELTPAALGRWLSTPAQQRPAPVIDMSGLDRVCRLCGKLLEKQSLYSQVS